MGNKKRAISLLSLFATMIFGVSVFLSGCNPAANHGELSDRLLSEPSVLFGPIKIEDLSPEELVQSIADELPHQSEIQNMYIADYFFSTAINCPDDQSQDGILTELAFSFWATNGEDAWQYEAMYDHTEHAMNLHDCQEKTTFPELGQELFSLETVLSALRYFPIESYREATQYGDEQGDLYRFSLQSGDSSGESFAYGKTGYLPDEGSQKFVNLSIAHCNWTDDSKVSFRGPVRANLHFVLNL